jgi:hypothetical protein
MEGYKMIKIIETNLNNDSFQSRVIEVESWKYIIDQFINDEKICTKIHKDIFNSGYIGVIRPMLSCIENLKYDDKRLSCDIIYYKGRARKLIQVTCDEM